MPEVLFLRVLMGYVPILPYMYLYIMFDTTRMKMTSDGAAITDRRQSNESYSETITSHHEQYRS